MNSTPVLAASSRASPKLVETLRRSLSHDVRTPLGTIVNYSAVLETSAEPNAREVQTLARKMRDNAMRAASMLQQVSDAVCALAAGEATQSDLEIAPLLDGCLGPSIAPRAVDVAPNGHPPAVRAHRATLTFLWTALFRADRELRGPGHAPVSFEATADEHRFQLRVWMGEREAVSESDRELAAWLADEGRELHDETKLALELAAGLIDGARGACRVRGELGAACEIDLRLPLAV